MIETYKDNIEQKINEIETEYRHAQGMILTEDDLKCLLYKKIMEIGSISEPKETQDDQILAHSIHTEVSWYDSNGKLTIKPDLTILEPKHLSILHRYGSNLSLPSKQFEFNGKSIIFELKFIRNKTGIRQKTLESKIKKDFEKINILFERLESQGISNDVYCYFIIFNKTDIRCQEFNEFIEKNRESEKHKIIYATGKVNFDKSTILTKNYLRN
ncbi:MAG: hypothetical protein ACOCRK_05065 [bacterium]